MARQEGQLRKETRWLTRWERHYFVLEEGVLKQYDKKSQTNGKPKRILALSASTQTNDTNITNCFCVAQQPGATRHEKWYLESPNEEMKDRWMCCLNAQVHALYVQLKPPPDHGYWGTESRGTFYYKMHGAAPAQWVLCYPELDSPRTGDGVFPGETVEAEQVLERHGTIYLRMTHERGWVFVRKPGAGSPVLFVETAAPPGLRRPSSTTTTA
ncbi:unnamed protein product [Phaeothamnion confervicola]